MIVALLAGAGVGLYWFQPWKLFTTSTVHDALSTPAPTMSAAASPTAPAGPVLLAQGAFVTQEHQTTGTARIVGNPDGSRRLELVNLATSDGPDLRVWLTAQKVVGGLAGAYVFDDGAYLDLDRLKGNRGDQVYEIPTPVDLSQYRSVSIWCRRFSVSFGAAPLDPITSA